MPKEISGAESEPKMISTVINPLTIKSVNVKPGDILVFQFEAPMSSHISRTERQELKQFFEVDKKVNVIFTEAKEISRLTCEDISKIDIKDVTQQWRQQLYERLHYEFGCRIYP